LRQGVQRPDDQMIHEGVVAWADPVLCAPDGLPLVAKLKHPSRREYAAPDDATERPPDEFASRCVTPERIAHAIQHLTERGRWDDDAPDADALARRVVQDVSREVPEYQDMIARFGKRTVRRALDARARELLG